MMRPLGYDVDDNASRFSNYFHVLRELVHFTNGWMPLEPSWERKYALGDHVHDDARALTKIKRRLYELRHPSEYPGSPSPELERLLDRMARRGQRAGVPDRRLHRGEAGARARDARSTSTTSTRWPTSPRCGCSPRSSSARSGTPTGTAASTPTSARCRCACASEPRASSASCRRSTSRCATTSSRSPRPGDPYLSRELYVNGAENHVPVEREEQQHFFHGLMDAELCAAELMARNSHEHPEMPWDFHVDMARQNWDEVRHARLHDLLMKDELGCAWGDFPVGFSYFKSIYAYDLLGRLCLFNGTSEQRAMWRHSHRRKTLMELGQERVALVFDYLLADEVPHVHNGVRWGSYLLGGSERATATRSGSCARRWTRRARRPRPAARCRRRSSSGSGGAFSSSSTKSSSFVERPWDLGRAAVAAVVGGLEGLEQLVAAGLVHGHLVGDQHPVRALELLQVEDLAVDRGGVVHHDHDLGLRVEVAARAEQQVVEIEASFVGHQGQPIPAMGLKSPPRSRSWRSISVSTSSGSLPWRSRRSLRAITSWRTSSRSAGSPAPGAARGERRELRLDVERRLAAGLAAARLRLEHLADLLLGLGRRGGRLRSRSQLEVAAPEPAVDAAASPVGHRGDQHGEHRDGDQDDAEGVHGDSLTLTRCGSAYAAGPSRRAARRSIPDQIGLLSSPSSRSAAGIYVVARFLL